MSKAPSQINSMVFASSSRRGCSPSIHPVLCLLVALSLSSTLCAQMMGNQSPGSVSPSTFTPQRKITKLAEGVYEIQHPDVLPGFPEGNTTVIIGQDAVFVVDSGYLPSTTRKDIAQIREWTQNPVRFLMNTHGHTDHTTGNGIYAREFPGLAIIAHRATRTLMSRYTPGYPELFTAATDQLKKTLVSGLGDDGKPIPADIMRELGQVIARREASDDDIHSMGKNVLPNVLLDDGHFRIDLGGRDVQVMFLGRGNTAGDLVAFLPKERIAVVGDIVVHPVPYTCSGFPLDWSKTLGRIEALAPETIVPGHGEVMHDLKYVETLKSLLDTVATQVDGAFQRVLGVPSLEQVQHVVDVSAFRASFPSGDQYNHNFFGRSVPNCLVRNTYYQMAPR
jgi:cyclase